MPIQNLPQTSRIVCSSGFRLNTRAYNRSSSTSNASEIAALFVNLVIAPNNELNGINLLAVNLSTAISLCNLCTKLVAGPCPKILCVNSCSNVHRCERFGILLST